MSSYSGRFAAMFLKNVPWFQDEKVCDGTEFINCYRPYNEQVLDMTATSARIVVQAIIIIGVIICFLCCKWRSLARSFIYLEVII